MRESKERSWGGGGPEPLKNSKFNLLNLHKKITKK